MLDYFTFLTGSDPPHEQIIRQYKLLLLQGLVKDGDEIPSRRRLAVKLGVNPKTVQKAYAELEAEGFIHTALHKATSTVRASDALLARLRMEMVVRDAQQLAATAISVGTSLDELTGIIKDSYGRELS